MGYTTQKINVDKDQLNILLVADNVLGEVVVTGYGTKTRANLTGSVASVDI